MMIYIPEDIFGAVHFSRVISFTLEIKIAHLPVEVIKNVLEFDFRSPPHETTVFETHHMPKAGKHRLAIGALIGQSIQAIVTRLHTSSNIGNLLMIAKVRSIVIAFTGTSYRVDVPLS